MCLPRPAKTTTAIGEQETRLRGARILLTEDNEINQQIAVELLEGAGATVTVANNGREAVEILSNGPQPPPFDVVLMDLQMPVMDGYQATAKLRSDARFATLPIIAMTAHATMEEKQRCLAAGMNDHISKPIDPDNLFETVGRFYKTMEGAQIVEPQQSQGKVPEPNEIPSVKGLDTKDGLARVAGNRKLYMKLLHQFVSQQGSANSLIADALAKNDRVSAERLAHTVKGVAGNLGARELQQVAGTLEKAISAKSPSNILEEAQKNFGLVLDDFVGCLRAALPQEASQQAAVIATVDSEELRRLVQEMLTNLNNFDPAAGDLFDAHRDAFRSFFTPETFEKFEKQIGGFAFADAMTVLQDVAKQKGVLS